MRNIFQKHIFTFPEISSILSQILKAATYLHENGWVHSNICSHNIMLSRYQSNVVKLTSFELATAINSSEDSKKAITRKLTDAFTNFNLEEIPYKLLPYFIEYRQLYSEENYQSPELFATDSKFVFPTKQSDVYGITLILWELLNSESPCAIFGQLPNLQEDRCREYKDILKQGLEINPNKRIENTIVLIEMLGKVSNEPKKDASIVDCFTSLLSPKSHGDVIYGRTSTIKKKKLSNPERKIPAKQLFVPIEEKKIDGQKLVNSTTKGDYQFDIGEISLPDTPIALSNKLRKAAWLSNKSLSPIVHVDSIEDLNKSKKYKVNITIVQKPNDLDAAGNSPQISNQIKYWNTIGTSSSTPNNINEDQLEKTAKNANVIQNSGIQFNEIFLKNHLSSNSDFENTLWRKEKEKCQSKNLIGNNTVIFSPSRVSVKDAINKFESFSKSFNNGSNENESNAAICKITKSKSFITKPEKRQSRKSISKSSSLEDINVSKLNLTLRNNVDENFNHKFTPSITPCSSAASEVNIDKIVNSEKPLKLTLNFKHLERRASDVGTYFLHSQPLNNERKNDVRGSIYGTEILKRLNKAAGDQNMGLKRTDSKKIKVGKLTCLNCGHKLFLVDDKGEFLIILA